MSNFTAVEERLSRIETRLVRGFNELGIDVTQGVQKPLCIPYEKTVVLPSLDVPVAVLMKTALDSGLRIGYSEITVECDGKQLFKF